jgi:hypothetical protein
MGNPVSFRAWIAPSRGSVASGRDERRAMLAAIIEIVKAERDVYPSTPALIAECEDVLERCLFDRDAALAVLRGEHELDDDPWMRCPDCDCDTYFRLRVEVGESRIGGALLPIGPLLLLVCEACQHMEVRPRASVDEGRWWERGVRARARPEDVTHPYRGVVDDEPEDDEEDAFEDEAETEAVEEATQPLEWSERKVCPDGACIGVIGDDGRCKVCGRVGE